MGLTLLVNWFAWDKFKCVAICMINDKSPEGRIENRHGPRGYRLKHGPRAKDVKFVINVFTIFTVFWKKMYFSRQKNADDLFLVIYPKIKEITHFSSESANNWKNRLDIWPPGPLSWNRAPRQCTPWPLSDIDYLCTIIIIWAAHVQRIEIN